jgi:rhodanese-related sulfurtransferase
MRMVRFLLRLIERLRGSFAWIEANELKRRLDGGEDVTIIDVRGSDEFVGPVAELESRLGELAGLERAPIVLVCRTDKRSATAARTLRAAAFTQVNVLRRGMEQWNETGLPVEARAAESTATPTVAKV